MKKGRSGKLKDDVNRKKAKLQETQTPLAIPTFAAPSTEQTATSGTMGLLTVEEFRQKRESMVQAAAAEKQKTLVKERQASARASKAARARISFADDDGGDGSDEEERLGPGVGKDPTVETSFLPDSHREEGLCCHGFSVFFLMFDFCRGEQTAPGTVEKVGGAAGDCEERVGGGDLLLLGRQGLAPGAARAKGLHRGRVYEAGARHGGGREVGKGGGGC